MADEPTDPKMQPPSLHGKMITGAPEPEKPEEKPEGIPRMNPELPPRTMSNADWWQGYEKGCDDKRKGMPPANLEGKSEKYKAGYNTGYKVEEGKK